MANNFEERVKETGLKLYSLAEGEKPSLFKKDYWTGKVMDWSMKNEAFKREMFRFVDVFPYLTRPESVAQHIQEYFCRSDQDFPKSMQWGLKMVKPDSMGKQFITGSTIQEAGQVMKKLRDQGVGWTVKILKEAVTSRKDEEEFVEKQIALLEAYHQIMKDWPALGGASGDLDWGFTPKNNVSLMASCLFSQYQTKACAFDYVIDMAKERLRPIYRKGMEIGAYVLLDMEHLPAREMTIAIFKSINDEIELGKKDAILLVSHGSDSQAGHFVPPTVFVDVHPDSRLAQEEIFGPVLSVIKVDSFDEALRVANGTQYALTGGVFSRSPAIIEKACRLFDTGTLYINRAITGALMQRHPFGGYKMSGVGSKAMGADYLPQFMFTRTIVENTFRSGFA